MKHIKTFEGFDFSQTLPIAPKSELTTYYSCDDCDAMWEEFNKECEQCEKCNSKNIEELSPEEYKELSNKDNDDEEEYIDLLSLKNRKVYGN